MEAPVKRRNVYIVAGLLGALGLALGWLLQTTKEQAHGLLTQRIGYHTVPAITPTAFGLAYEDVLISSSDAIELVGWFIPSRNGAVVIAQHGYKDNRGEMLNEAAILNEHGYGVLITSVRAHDTSDGEAISFGVHEMDDLEAWYQYLLTRPDVDPGRIGMLGNSYGGALVIEYAARNPQIRAVVANSPFASLNDTVTTSVTFFANVPAFPFVPLILFWAEQEAGFKAADIDTTAWIAKLSPRAVLLMQGGRDVAISTDSGQLLYDAAGEPKELWFEPELGHTMFDRARPQEYEQRVVAFFDRYLLGAQP
jgi:fermentation-respiration switch protein FrsA (DUF1100 family)